MWINYKDEMKNVSDKILSDYLEQVDIMINNMRKVLVEPDSTYEKIIIDVFAKTKNNNTFQNLWFLKNFLKDDIEKDLIDKLELLMYEGILKISVILIENYICDIEKILIKQNFSNRAINREIENFIKSHSDILHQFTKEVISEHVLKVVANIENIKLMYLISFIEDNDDFFIQYEQDDYIVGLTKQGLEKSLKEMNELGIKSTVEENILIAKRLGYYSEKKERKTSNDTKKYINEYKVLNKIAYDNGFKLVRVVGSHGVFKNQFGKIIIIPQGRSIGKGLSLKIQEDIMRGNLFKTDHN